MSRMSDPTTLHQWTSWPQNSSSTKDTRTENFSKVQVEPGSRDPYGHWYRRRVLSLLFINDFLFLVPPSLCRSLRPRTEWGPVDVYRPPDRDPRVPRESTEVIVEKMIGHGPTSQTDTPTTLQGTGQNS